jgi:Asp-tRNA(Asn)/Glu-tRNA(Gln) amidotransferase A subunit family amidase
MSRGLVAGCVVAAGAAFASPASARAQVGVVVHERSIVDLGADLAAGRTTSVRLVDAYLARIAAYDAAGPALASMLRRSPRARADAARLDAERAAGRVRGPLHGIPVVLKDNFATTNLPTSAGSLGLAGLTTPDEAFVVRRLREAGAVILGKTNMHELAAGITSISSLGGQTRNPYDPRRCPGGSSGGTGAAVAASFAAVGWGSDTCGSIRIPAAYNSLFGLRPTQGLVSRTGVLPLSHTQDIAGPLARTAMDLAIALEASVGFDPTDSTTERLSREPAPRFVAALEAASLRGVRLGMLGNYLRESDPDIRDTVRAAAAVMRQGGAELVEVSIPGLDSLMNGAGVLNFETKYDLIDYLARVPGAPAASLGEILDRGLYHDALELRLRRADTVSARDSEAYRRNLGRRSVLRDRLVGILDSLRLDALVYPTMLRRPVLIGDPQAGGTCQLSAHSGLPALSAPAGFTADGLPVGSELLGRPWDDARLLAIAGAFEATGPRRRPPPTTPPLVGGKAPRPIAFHATARGPGGGSAVGSFRFDPSTGELRYDVRLSGVAADSIQAVVLRRGREGRAGPVIHRVIGPGELRGRGQVMLVGVNRLALESGTLAMDLFAAGGAGASAPLTGRR